MNTEEQNKTQINNPIDTSVNIPVINKQRTPIILGVILFFFILFVAFLVTKKVQTPIKLNATKLISPAVPTPTPRVYDGVMQLSEKNGKTTVFRSSELTLIVTADSKGRDVTGYDAIIGFNPSMVGFKSARSLASDMTIFKYVKDSLVQITGTKSLSTTSLVYFNRSPIIEITFQPLQIGEAVFDLIDVKGKAKSQIVDSKSIGTLVTPSKTTIVIQ